MGGRLCHHHEPILLTFCVLDSCLSFLTDLRAPEPATAAWSTGHTAKCLWDSEDRATPPRGPPGSLPVGVLVCFFQEQKKPEPV